MHIFRLFGVSIIIPLITVGLLGVSVTGKSSKSKSGISLASQGKSSRELSNSTVSFPVSLNETSATTSHGLNDTTISPRLDSRHFDIHRTHTTLANGFSHFQGEGRGVGHLVYELYNVTWIFGLLWKAITSYAIVALVNILMYPLLKKFGWGGPYWETSINLGNEESKNHLLNFGPKLKNFRLSFGDHKGSSKKDEKVEGGGQGEGSSQGEHGGGGGGGAGGWGWPQQSHGHGHPGHVGFNPHVGPGWLSYDQYAGALPMVDKYSIKAAKKAQKYKKKAQKYAHKASKYAAKAQAATLAIKPLYANGYIHPGAATVPGHHAYGWGK